MAIYNATGTAEISVTIQASSQEEADQKLANGEWEEWEVTGYDLGGEADFVSTDGDTCDECDCLLSDEEFQNGGVCYDCLYQDNDEEEVLGEDTYQEDE
jgi:hypothetical protein